MVLNWIMYRAILSMTSLSGGTIIISLDSEQNRLKNHVVPTLMVVYRENQCRVIG